MYIQYVGNSRVCGEWLGIAAYPQTLLGFQETEAHPGGLGRAQGMPVAK